jgi:hypothetical protein
MDSVKLFTICFARFLIVLPFWSRKKKTALLQIWSGLLIPVLVGRDAISRVRSNLMSEDAPAKQRDLILLALDDRNLYVGTKV